MSLFARTLRHYKCYCDVHIQFALFRGTDQLSFSCEEAKILIMREKVLVLITTIAVFFLLSDYTLKAKREGT